MKHPTWTQTLYLMRLGYGTNEIARRQGLSGAAVRWRRKTFIQRGELKLVDYEEAVISRRHGKPTRLPKTPAEPNVL